MNDTCHSPAAGWQTIHPLCAVDSSLIMRAGYGVAAPVPILRKKLSSCENRVRRRNKVFNRSPQDAMTRVVVDSHRVRPSVRPSAPTAPPDRSMFVPGEILRVVRLKQKWKRKKEAPMRERKAQRAAEAARQEILNAHAAMKQLFPSMPDAARNEIIDRAWSGGTRCAIVVWKLMNKRIE